MYIAKHMYIIIFQYNRIDSELNIASYIHSFIQLKGLATDTENQYQKY